MDLARILVGIGLVLVVAGGVVWLFGRLGWPLPGRLPGDLVFRRDGFTFYFPLATSILLSVLLSLVFWIFRR